MSKLLQRALLLEKRDRRIMRLVAKTGNMAEAARRLGLTRARVQQIVKTRQNGP